MYAFLRLIFRVQQLSTDTATRHYGLSAILGVRCIIFVYVHTYYAWRRPSFNPIHGPCLGHRSNRRIIKGVGGLNRGVNIGMTICVLYR